MKTRLLIAVCGAVLIGWPAAAQENLTPEQQAEVKRLQGILASEHPQGGDIAIPAAKATLHLGDQFYFLPPEEAKRVIVEAWHNPAANADGVLGVVFPKGKTFADSWGAIVTYEAAGYVSDKDAKTADYNKLLTQSRDGEDEINQNRQKAGFPTIHLVGWAQAPTYDPVSHSEIWAKQVRFGGDTVDTLNYDTRILGRNGVLSLNLVSDINNLTETRTAASSLAKGAQFDSGVRYEDYKQGIDKKADYGVAGLVAAGLGVAAAQKFGLLALIALFAKKALVLIIALGAGIAAKFRKLFGLKPKAAKVSAPLNLSDPPEQNVPKSD